MNCFGINCATSLTHAASNHHALAHDMHAVYCGGSAAGGQGNRCPIYNIMLRDILLLAQDVLHQMGDGVWNGIWVWEYVWDL